MDTAKRTLTWAEKQRGHSPAVSFESLIDGAKPATHPEVEPLGTAVELLLRSGFPAHIDATSEQSRKLLREYLTDVSLRADIRHAPVVFTRLIRSIAGHCGEVVSIATVSYTHLTLPTKRIV